MGSLLEDKYIGLGLAISSSIAIGTSFIITKKGLQAASNKHGFEGDGFEYLRNPVWWAGMITMAIGEIANFAAYTFAPAILVTPLGALSVIIGAVLASFFLKEQLGVLGKMGCAICLIGSVIIILHAPPDKEVKTVDEILDYAIRPGFLIYVIIVAVFASVMIFKIAPKYGRTNPMIYISICSTVGSLSVMAIKGFGIAVKLTFGGNNQFTHYSTYVFIIVVAVCILTQMNYFNKALDQFDTSIVNPLYYVTFTTATLVASFILFQGFNTANPVNNISLILGFVIIFMGVYLLNISRGDPDGKKLLITNALDGMPMDNTVAGMQTRLSMQFSRSSSAGRHRRSDSLRNSFGEEGVNLTRFDRRNVEDDEEYELDNPKQSSRLLRSSSQGSRSGSTSRA